MYICRAFSGSRPFVNFILSTWTTSIFYARINLLSIDNTTYYVEDDFLTVLNDRKSSELTLPVLENITTVCTFILNSFNIAKSDCHIKKM